LANRGDVPRACHPQEVATTHQTPSTEADPGFGRARLEAISDGVIAVAITLLALGIDAPTPAPGQTLWQAFDKQTLGEIGLFLLSFFLIARFWLLHHRLFRDLPEFVPTRFVIVNFGFLASLCLMPFATTTYSENAEDMTALVIYSVLIATTTILLTTLFRLTGNHSWRRSLLPPAIILLAIPVGLVLGAQYAPFVWGAFLVVGVGRLHHLRRSH
jgi:uncharacterized membrane protein